jgi:hypothetical protein
VQALGGRRPGRRARFVGLRARRRRESHKPDESAP